MMPFATILLAAACEVPMAVSDPDFSVVSVTVAPKSVMLSVGDSMQLSATVLMSNNRPPRSVSWTSSTPAVASVSQTGMAHGVAPGAAVIFATSGNKRDSSAVTVVGPSPVPVASVTVTPASATLVVASVLQLTATPKDAAGNVLSGRTVTWSSDNTSLATVTSSGLVTGKVAGSAVITATSEGHSGTSAISVQAPPPGSGLAVFPGAEGFGTTTAAGRGGAILRVTNLNDNGAGSLRAALEASGPRVVIFEVSGTIVLTNDIQITSPFITVAGQTAPSPGVTLRRAGIRIATHDVLIQHLRIRVGDEVDPTSHGDRNGIMIDHATEAYNIVIDHISASWSLDRNIATWYTLHDVTFSDCIISEPLLQATPLWGAQAYGFLIGDHADRFSVIGNLFAHVNVRNPYAKGDTYTLIVNNLIYDPGEDAISLSDWDGSGLFQSSIVGNVMIAGPSTTDPWIVSIVSPVPAGSRVYMADNLAPQQLYESPNIGFEPVVSTAPVWTSPLTVLPASQVEAQVLAAAGARPADRDAVDLRIINEEQTRTGHIITSQNDVGGWPVLAENVRPLTPPANPNGDDNGNGYTNLEEWLQQLAAQVEGR